MSYPTPEDIWKVLSESGRYTPIQHIETGGTSYVYLAKDSDQHDQAVALKVLIDPDALQGTALKRFEIEYKTLREINHPNVVAVYDLIKVDDYHVLSMEYVDGYDLGYYVDEKNKLSYEQIDQIFIGLLKGLSELHKKNMIHRDLKLEQVILAKSGAPKLIDLGMVKDLSKDALKLTFANTWVGTSFYLAPEYLIYGKLCVQSDFYAVAFMLQELLTGKRRLSHISDEKVSLEALRDELIKTNYEPSEMVIGHLPEKYKSIIRKAGRRDPKKRYQNAQEIIADLEQSHEESFSRSTMEHETVKMVNQIRLKSASVRNDISSAALTKNSLRTYGAGLLLVILVAMLAFYNFFIP